MDPRHNFGGGGFGRRGGQLMQAPASAPRAAPPQARAPREKAPAGERPSLLRLASYVFLGLLGLISLEALLSDTTLISPINPAFLNIMRVAGFAFGLPLSLKIVFNPNRPIGILRKILVLLFLPLGTGYAGNEAAWRIYDWKEFAFSNIAFSPASYPIMGFSRGRKGARDAFEIDPFDLRDGTKIAVPSAQYDAMWLSAENYCIAVMQRRSPSGAVEILNDGVFNFNSPAPAVLTPCPEAAQLQERRRQEEAARRARRP